MKRLILSLSLCLLFATTALAHWDVGDPCKMHFAQLPDPYGWDVAFSNTVLADDWQCSQTGYVRDIHFWISFKGSFEPSEDFVGPSIWVGIFANDPGGEGEYSTPVGDPLWSRVFEDGQYEGEDAETIGLQGWLDPVTEEATPGDHTAYYLLNIENIDDPFLQEEGTIYWLEIQLASETPGYEVGWKTSISPHFMDDAVYYVPDAGWQELRYPANDPRAGQSIDLAFVITPEPATVCLLGLGTLSLIHRKK